MTRQSASLAQVLTNEGFRLFFPLAAVHAALWPFLWVAVQHYDLLGASKVAASVWHMHEMLVGAFGAALIGFLSTAFPKWVNTPPLKGRALWMLAALWGIARAIGLFGIDALGVIAALADIAWLMVLIVYGVRLSWQRQTDTLLPFLGWLLAFLAAEVATRFFMLQGDNYLAGEAIKGGALVFIGILGLALARIAVPVTNLVLDPSEETSPYRPHPGRQNLASGMVAILLVGHVVQLSPTVVAWLYVAAGAAFLDRVGEAFIGKAVFRVEILGLMFPSVLTGAGFIWLGATELGAPVPVAGGWHLVLMGGLGIAVLAVLSIAGLFHAGQTLPVGKSVKIAFVSLNIAIVLRLLPELGIGAPGIAHLLASVFWALGFLVWLWRYWPLLSDPDTLGQHEGC